MPDPGRPPQAGPAPATSPLSGGARSKEVSTTRPAPAKLTARLRARPAHRPAERPRPRPLPRRQLPRRLRAPLVAAGLVLALAAPAYAAAADAAPSLSGVISNLTTWLVGILAGVATLFLTIGGLRYLTAGGDPGQVERAKTALKSAAIGYALAVLAPVIVSVLASVVGGA